MTAQPWPTSAPTLRLSPVPGPAEAAPTPPAAPAAPVESTTDAPRTPTVARVREIATAPSTALVVMLLGLALLFVWPTVGLPFVGVVVLPAVVYHLRAEHRVRLRRARR